MSTKAKTEIDLTVAPAGCGASPEGERSDLPALRACSRTGRRMRFVTVLLMR